MTQYILKKETFGIPAGTIAKPSGKCYGISSKDALEFFSLFKKTVEQGDDFEKVEEPKHNADCSRVTVSCGDSEYEVYAEAWGDFIEEHALVDDEPEWEKRFDAAYNYPPSEQVRRLKDFMLDEYLIMGEEIMELSNNQTNRAFCDDVMQVMRERGAIK